MATAGPILLAVLAVLSVMWVHEAGHVIAARLTGVRIHQIRFRPGWASVTMDAPEKPGQKAAVGAGGAAANLAAALVLFSLFAAALGTAQRLPAPVLVDPDGALPAGSEIRAINGDAVQSSVDLQALLAAYRGEEVVVRTQHGDIRWQVPPAQQAPAVIDRYYDLQSPGPAGAIREGARTLAEMLGAAGASARLVASDGWSALAGPIAAVAVLAETLRAEPWAAVYFLAVLNVSVAVINLLPLPGLDGYWVLVGGLEAVGRRTLPAERVAAWARRGVWLWVALAALLLFKDIWMLWTARGL